MTGCNLIPSGEGNGKPLEKFPQEKLQWRRRSSMALEDEEEVPTVSLGKKKHCFPLICLNKIMDSIGTYFFSNIVTMNHIFFFFFFFIQHFSFQFIHATI